MGKSSKGGAFERQFCKELSLWWTGQQRDDVFWRTAGSGGRATQRAKTGRSTANSYGDILATDPIGQPLIQFFTLELKRGYPDAHIGDLADRKPLATKNPRPLEAMLAQASLSASMAQTPHWMLVVKRDGKEPVLYIPPIKRLFNSLPQHRFRFHTVATGDVQMFQWSEFQRCCSPERIHDALVRTNYQQ